MNVILVLTMTDYLEMFLCIVLHTNFVNKQVIKQGQKATPAYCRFVVTLEFQMTSRLCEFYITCYLSCLQEEEKS